MTKNVTKNPAAPTTNGDHQPRARSLGDAKTAMARAAIMPNCRRRTAVTLFGATGNVEGLFQRRGPKAANRCGTWCFGSLPQGGGGNRIVTIPTDCAAVGATMTFK